jgi:hypothetical protein
MRDISPGHLDFALSAWRLAKYTTRFFTDHGQKQYDVGKDNICLSYGDLASSIGIVSKTTPSLCKYRKFRHLSTLGYKTIAHAGAHDHALLGATRSKVGCQGWVA